VSASLYEPINQFKPQGAQIGIVDGPFEYLTVAGVTMPLPFTTRMTVVRLANGHLFLHSPIRFDPGLADQLRTLGDVRHLVSPNQFHYAHIAEWSKAFPEAVTWASPRVRRRARARRNDVHFQRDLAEEAAEDWRGDIDQALFPGGYFKEYIFFHRVSRTLILADTIFNLELDKIEQPWRTIAAVARMDYPRGQTFFGMRLPVLLQRRRSRAVMAKIRAWQPERVILSHGRCFDADASEITRRLFGGSRL